MLKYTRRFAAPVALVAAALLGACGQSDSTADSTALANDSTLNRDLALANRDSVLRSVTHRDNDHAIGAYLALTGYSHPKNAILGIEPPATPLDMQ